MRLPTNQRDLTKLAVKLIEDCSVSLGQRQSSYRQYGQWLETGRAAGGLSRANMLYGHVDRLASHIFSPTDLRFAIDFERLYEQIWHDRAAVVARTISRAWERKNVDIWFGVAVRESLAYGSFLVKQLAGSHADQTFNYMGCRLVPPWRFGVYNESVNELDNQEVLMEVMYLTRAEVWRRIRRLDGPEKLFKRILAQSDKENSIGAPTSFMHQVLSTAILNTSLQNMTQPQPGGIVQLTNDPNFATLGPQVAPELYPLYELWIKDDARGGEDYTTIQMFSPDILIHPGVRSENLFIDRRRIKVMVRDGDDKKNLLVKETHPYTLVQPNIVTDYFWGRSEIVDLMELQDWLTEHLDDIKRLTGLQVDMILGFEGVDGITDETYGQYRGSGYAAVPQGGSIKNLTPPVDFAGMIALVREILALMDKASGFPPIMSGSGEPGVRAGVHADTLMKTGSPRLRDRSLIVERNCNSAADVTLAVYEAKDARGYWTDPKVDATDFVLGQLLEDRRITVDAHSGSPIYHDDHANLLAWGVKLGIITPESAIEQLPFNHKDILIQRLKAKEEAEAKLIEKYGIEVILGHKSHGGGQSRAA